MDLRLSLLSRPLITSIIVGFDVFPRLCVGSVLDLRDVVLAMCNTAGSAQSVFSEVTERAFNYMRRTTAKNNEGARESNGSTTDDRQGAGEIDPDLAWFWSLRKTLSAAIDTRAEGEGNEKLFPAGRLLWLRREPCAPSSSSDSNHPSDESQRARHKFAVCEIVDPREVLGRIEFAEGIFVEHIPLLYDEAVRATC